MIEALATKVLEAVVGKAAETLFEKLTSLSNDNSESNRRSDRAELSEFSDAAKSTLRSHLYETEKWSRNISFNLGRHRKRVSQVFLELDTYVIPLSRTISDASDPSPVRGAQEPYRASDNLTEPLLAALRHV